MMKPRISLFAEQEREDRRAKLGDPLVGLVEHVDFEVLAARIDAAAPRPSHAKGGRPPYPTVLMIKILMLQQLYNLADDALEYQLLDRRSFLRFLDLTESSSIPDAKTIWLFRDRLSQAGVGNQVFEQVQQQLLSQGYLARCGQIVDVSLVQAPVQHNKREEAETYSGPEFETVVYAVVRERMIANDEGKKRRTHPAEFKARIGLEAVRGVKTINEIAQEHNVHPQLVTQWKKEILENASSLFDTKRGPKPVDENSPEDKLYSEIGRLKMETDWLKENWGVEAGINGCYVWCRTGDGEYEGRNFNHLDPRLEDSATGVAAGALTVLLGHGLVLRQGRATGRRCLMRTELEGDTVRVGGQVRPGASR